MTMAFKLIDLPYADTALEPAVSAETLSFHHGKHHQTYIDKTNAAIEGTEHADKSLEEVIAAARGKNQGLFNNSAQSWNHGFYWHSMAADGGAPSDELAVMIDDAFGSFDAFKEELKNAGIGQFGSGWAWLIHDGSGLAVVSTPNQDTPVSDGKTPIIGVDVWEHAYYLKYQNKRPDYLDAWWNVVNWAKAAEHLSNAS